MNRKLFYAHYFFYYFAFSCLSVNMIPFLKEIGYSSTQRGVLFAISAVCGIFMQFLVGYISDKYKLLKKICILLQLCMLLFSFLFYLNNNSNFIWHLWTLLMANGLYKVLYNLLDSWILESEIKKQFGNCRAFGALGFTLGTLMSTFLIKQIGYGKVSYFVMFGVLGGLLFTSRLKEEIKGSGLSKLTIDDWKQLFHNRMYWLLILLFLLINISGTADQYTTVDKLMSLEANESQIGLKWAIQSLCEIPLFLYGYKLLERFKAYPLLVVGTILYILKFILYGWINSVNGMLFVTAMQLVTYPLITLSSRVMVSAICKEGNLKTSTQMIASGIYLGVSALVSPLLCGYLVDLMGSSMTLYVLGGFLIIPLWIMYHYRKSLKEING